MRFKPFALALLLACPILRAHAQDAREGNPLTLAQVKDSVDGFELSPDGKSVVLWGVDWGDPNNAERKRQGKVQVWDVATHTLKANMVGHVDAVQHALWSRDGRLIASQSQDGMVALWDAQSGQLKQTLRAAGGELKFGRDPTPEEVGRSMKAAAERPRLLGFSPDGSQVLALGGKVELPKAAPKDKDGKPRALHFFSFVQPLLLAWDTSSGKVLRSVPFSKAGVLGTMARLLPDGKSFVISVGTLVDQDLTNNSPYAVGLW